MQPNNTVNVEWVLPFSAISKRDLAKVGGKGANLGEMVAAGFPVPGGFCVTTVAFRDFMAGAEGTDALFSRLRALNYEDTDAVRRIGEEVRTQLRKAPIPEGVGLAIETAWREAGVRHFYAVRSSATAEDLPHASFAGQQDTYLHIKGREQILEKVRDCWVSLFTDRAITYRAKNGFDHQRVLLSVVVQQMVASEVSGILFTADPLDGRRHVTSIDAGFGLGEALVSGLVSADLYKVDKRDGSIIEKKIAQKKLAIFPLPNGGTEQVALSPEQQTQASLTDAQAIALSALGAKIEAHYGKPQDIEWCIEAGLIFIVQSRPITTLFPIPEGANPSGPVQVFFSFNHAQVMTDAMPPLAMETWRRLMPFGRGAQGLSEILTPAGGRLYIEITPVMRTRNAETFVRGMEKGIDALMAGAIEEVISRPDFGARDGSLLGIMSKYIPFLGSIFANAMTYIWVREPTGSLAHLERVFAELLAEIDKATKAAPAGAPRLQETLKALREVFLQVLPAMAPVFLSGVLSAALLRKILAGRGVDKELVSFEQGLEGNVTTEMDLAFGDLADIARRTPSVVAHLQTADPKRALQTLASVPGSQDFAQAVQAFLEKYGMRGPSEIDISRQRWNEDPTQLVQIILGNLSRPEPGMHRAHHARQKEQGHAAGEAMIQAAPRLQRGLVRRLVKVARNNLAVREHPKFLLVKFLWLLKGQLLACAAILQQQGKLDAANDIFFLSFDEIIRALEGSDTKLRDLIEARRLDHERFQKMSPPRAITNQGEALTRPHKARALPPNSLAGSAASPGIVEGIAKVVLDPSTAVLAAGEILVAPFTDPGWTPLFINAAGLVMEVGGLMTHGSVVAREYGLPAVVCVPDATKLIKTGQRLRVNGDEGWVEILG